MINVHVCPRSTNISAHLPFSPSSPAPPSEPPSKLIARLYEEERPFVRRLVLQRGVPTRDADDVVQDVFLVVCRRIADLDATRTARPWLYVIAMRSAANYRKLARHSREDLPGILPDAQSLTEDLEDLIAYEEERAHFRARLAHLRPKHRAVLIPYALEERPMSEIATALGIPEATAHARLRLARTALTRHTCSPPVRTASRHQRGHTQKQ